MFLGIPQAVATLVTVFLSYALNFILINCYGRPGQQASQGVRGSSYASQNRKGIYSHKRYAAIQNTRIGLPASFRAFGGADDSL
jgi:hypothetical protein